MSLFLGEKPATCSVPGHLGHTLCGDTLVEKQAAGELGVTQKASPAKKTGSIFKNTPSTGLGEARRVPIRARLPPPRRWLRRGCGGPVAF